MTRKITRTLACLLATGVLASGASGASPRRADPSPSDYYLALGDSLTFGFQLDKLGLRPAAFHSGYVDVFANRLRAQAPRIQVVNYGCPGESSITFLKGGCPWVVKKQPLHQTFQGSQMSAALAFLTSHRGHVSPITIALGGNDVNAFAGACQADLACMRAHAPGAIAAFASRLGSIVHRLRAAAPGAEIIVIGTWNEDIDRLAQTNPFYHTLDAAIAKSAARSRARFADMLPIFNPPGSVPKMKARICALTFICSQGDGHPTDAGYNAIATAVLAASRFTRRS